jgi:hypothetical protein
MNDDLLIRKPAPDEEVEIVRSFSLKRNLETHLGPQYKYESADYFCSAKTKCSAQEAERKSGLLDAYCKAEVLKSINKFEAECLAAQSQKRRTA